MKRCTRLSHSATQEFLTGVVAINVTPFTFVEELCGFGFAFAIAVLAGDVVGSRFGVAGVIDCRLRRW